MYLSQISASLFRNSNKTSFFLLGVASTVFAAAPPEKEADLIPLRGEHDDFGRYIAARLEPLPKTYRVQEHYDDRYAGRTRSTRAGEEKIIYSNTNGQFLWRPGRGERKADDLITNLADSCMVSTLRLRVTGGVEGGGGVFRADVSLYDGCPDSDAGGTKIPGTLGRFSDLDDDLALFHDLVLDYSDRGICDDGTECQVSLQNCVDVSVCQPDPIQIPPNVWVRFGFDTDDAAVVAGSPPSIGYSSDGYADPQAGCNPHLGPCPPCPPCASCTAWFGGWPTWPHASFWVELIAPAECETYFVAYSAANPNRPPFLPADLGPPDVGSVRTRLGDDIRLSVDDCILGAFEIGMTGTGRTYVMSIDLRWPSILDVIPETTVRTVSNYGGSINVQLARFVIPPQIELSINRLDQPIYITWAANSYYSPAGVLEVDVTQLGESGPEFFALGTDPNNPGTWNTLLEPDGSPAVFYASVFCRGDAPHGACCLDQADKPGLDVACVDDVPFTSCLGDRWLPNTTCDENLFDPPCGTQACCLPDGSCEDMTRADCLATCDTRSPLIACQTDQDCPGERTCGTDADANYCTPVCATWSTGKLCGDEDLECLQPCEISDITTIFFTDSLDADPPGPSILTCAIDARQPHELNDSVALGWDRMVMQFACNAATLPWSVSDFYVTGQYYPKSIVFDDTRARLSVVFYWPIAPGKWTCLVHIDSGRRWCAGYLPGDTDQNRIVTAGDISALINAINLPPEFQPPIYATDINRSGVMTGADILRLIDLMNGAENFDPWITRSLPRCPSEP